MIILGLETSTEACSVALLSSDQQYIVSRFALAPRKHTELLPIQLSEVLEDSGVERAELTHIAFSNGPGAFTGIRIAASFAQGLALALNIPLVPVSSLAVLAQHACEQHQLSVTDALLDARMGELYVGRYAYDRDTEAVSLIGQETLIRQELYRCESDVTAVGSGCDALIESELLDSDGSNYLPDQYPHAIGLVELAARSIQSGQVYPPDQVEINYIRNRVAEKKQPLFK